MTKSNTLNASQRFKLQTYIHGRVDVYDSWDDATRHLSAAMGFTVSKSNIIGALKAVDRPRHEVVKCSDNSTPVGALKFKVSELESRVAALEQFIGTLSDETTITRNRLLSEG